MPGNQEKFTLPPILARSTNLIARLDSFLNTLYSLAIVKPIRSISRKIGIKD